MGILLSVAFNKSSSCNFSKPKVQLINIISKSRFLKHMKCKPKGTDTWLLKKLR